MMRKLTKVVAKVPLLVRVVSLYVVVFLVIFISSRIFEQNNKVVIVPLQVQTEKQINYGQIVEKAFIYGEPDYFTVERLGVNLPIKDGVFNEATGDWTLSDDAVYYAKVTALPNNQSGSTFLYGHNDDQVLAKLSGIVVGDVAVVKTTNGHTFTYAYTGNAIIPPDMTSVLGDNPATPRLTVMTCEGIWSQARRLMYFDLMDAN